MLVILLFLGIFIFLGIYELFRTKFIPHPPYDLPYDPKVLGVIHFNIKEKRDAEEWQ